MRFASAVTLGAFLCIAAPAVSAQDAPSSPRIAVAPVLAQGGEPLSDTAQQTSNPTVAQQIGAVVILGNEAIDDARYQAAVQDFFGEPLTDEVLARLVNEIADLAREAGYSYVRTSLDDSGNALGVVQVTVDEGRIDAVEIEGYQNVQAQRILDRLTGRPALKSELERALLLISDIPAVRVRDAKLRRKDGRGILLVRLEQKPDTYRVSADNYGSESFGPVRALLSTRQIALLTSSDELYASVRINPVELEELLFFSAGYETQLSANGIVFGVNASIGTTSPGDLPGDFDITGNSYRIGTSLRIPVMRAKKGSLWVEGNVNYIAIDQDNLGAILREDTVVTASIGLRTQWAVAGGRVRAGVSHVRGLGILGATRRGDPLASRSDGNGVFSKVEFWSDARVPVAKRMDLFLSAGGQIADRALLGSEEIALGGAYRTRGYGFSEVLGDEGVYGLAELRYRVATKNLPFDFLQLYAFVDGGYVSDIGNSFGEGTLFSAGPGVRGRIGLLDFEVEGGFPMGGSGERGIGNDPEINVRAGVNF